MSGETMTLAALFVPLVASAIAWAVVGRRRDNDARQRLEAEVRKLTAEGKVTESTIDAAVELAEVGLVEASRKAMAEAFREERESLSRRLGDAETKLTAAEHALDAAREVIAEVRADQQRAHREMLDMYRRDQHWARALEALTAWALRVHEKHPDIEAPPMVESLPPLHFTPDDLPARRWYDEQHVPGSPT